MRPAVLVFATLVVGCDQRGFWLGCNEQLPIRSTERLPESVAQVSGVATTAEGEELPFQVEARMKKGRPWRTSRPDSVLEDGIAVCLAGEVLKRETDLSVTVQIRGQDYTWRKRGDTAVVEDGGSGIEGDVGEKWPWPEVVGPLRDILLEGKQGQNNDFPPSEGGLMFMFAAGSERQEDRGFLQLIVTGEGGRTGDWVVHTMLSSLEFHEP